MEFASSTNSRELTLMGGDPFVAPRILDQTSTKSIEEILQRMNGFVTELDDPVSAKISRATKNVTSTENKQPISPPSNECRKGTVVFSPTQISSNLNKLPDMPRKASIPSVTIARPKNSTQELRIPTAQLFSVARKSETRCSETPVGKIVSKPFIGPNRETDVPVDIRDFVPASQPVGASQEVERQIEPLQCSFDFEMEYFERNAQLKRFDAHYEQSTAAESMSPTTEQPMAVPQQVEWSKPLEYQMASDDPSQNVSGRFPEDRPENPSLQPATQMIEAEPMSGPETFDDEEAQVVWVRENELICVDGREGYDYIDLTCFEVSQASFESNRIRINNGVRVFEIEYRNVSHAVFANGKQVELAAYDLDFPKPVN